jgi:hypothetical protein
LRSRSVKETINTLRHTQQRKLSNEIRINLWIHAGYAPFMDADAKTDVCVLGHECEAAECDAPDWVNTG